MEKLSFEGIWQNINCLVPIYSENGANMTEVHLDDGTVAIDGRKICTVIKNLAKFFTVDVETARAKYSKLVDRKLSVPIPLHQDLVLVPVKIRKPIAREDGAWGYVVLSKIVCYTKHPEKDKTIWIFFDNELYVDALLLTRSFQIILESAKKVNRAYRHLHLITVINNNDDLLKEEFIKYCFIPFMEKNLLQYRLMAKKDREKIQL
ncbi:MAG: hypothetical protein APF76_14955 [Desulfitibacter sp. BRH_c19]|nr:MAG: hypothetical protein APF76_14955 [Desulfitibacter sp. BRH_c19]